VQGAEEILKRLEERAGDDRGQRGADLAFKQREVGKEGEKLRSRILLPGAFTGETVLTRRWGTLTVEMETLKWEVENFFFQ
jgi:hypothetical protein